MAFEEAFGFPALFALLNVVAAIIAFFTLGEGDFQFSVTSFGEEKFEGDEREAFLGEAALEAVEFVSVEEELSGAAGIYGNITALVVRGYIEVINVEFGAFEGAEGVLKVSGASAQRFDFWAGEDNASRVALQNIVIMEGFSVGDSGGHKVKIRRFPYLAPLLARREGVRRSFLPGPQVSQAEAVEIASGLESECPESVF